MTRALLCKVHEIGQMVAGICARAYSYGAAGTRRFDSKSTAGNPRVKKPFSVRKLRKSVFLEPTFEGLPGAEVSAVNLSIPDRGNSEINIFYILLVLSGLVEYLAGGYPTVKDVPLSDLAFRYYIALITAIALT
ncbi:jg27767, partial [Pararge aegeria aegeria]